MTSPVHIPSDFRCEIYLPNNSQKKLRIEPVNENKGESVKGNRNLILISRDSEEIFTEEIILSPFDHFEFEGEYDEESIIRSFHTDEIEFI